MWENKINTIRASFGWIFDSIFPFYILFIFSSHLYVLLYPQGPKLPSDPRNGKSLQASRRCDHTNSCKKQPNETTEPDIKSLQQKRNESTEAGRTNTHGVTVVGCKNRAGVGVVVIQSDLWPHCEITSNRGYRWGSTQGRTKHTHTRLTSTHLPTQQNE